MPLLMLRVMPVVEIMMSPIMALSFYNSCKTSLSLGLALDLVLVKVVSTTSLFQAHTFWDEGKQEEFLIAGEFNYRPEQRFLNLYFFPYFLALVSLFCCEVGANIYSLSVYLVVLLSQTSPGYASNAQFVYVEARVRVFSAGMGYSSVVTAFFFFQCTTTI